MDIQVRRQMTTVTMVCDLSFDERLTVPYALQKFTRLIRFT